MRILQRLRSALEVSNYMSERARQASASLLSKRSGANFRSTNIKVVAKTLAQLAAGFCSYRRRATRLATAGERDRLVHLLLLGGGSSGRLDGPRNRGARRTSGPRNRWIVECDFRQRRRVDHRADGALERADRRGEGINHRLD